MPFTTQEVNNIANASLDFFLERGQVHSNTIQTKPLLAALDAKAKDFPGGKGSVSLSVKGQYTTRLQGYVHDQQVAYQNPANIKRVNYPWREHHAGISLTLTELKNDGISVVDSLDSAEVSEHDDREMTALVDLLDDKLEDMSEGYDRGLNGFLWGDGTQDPLALAGIRSLILDVPGTGTTGGLDRAGNPWWNNRSNVSSPIAFNTANGGAYIQFLQNEYRQLIRYGGKPDLWLAGSDFINGLEQELRANGRYTLDGFTMKKSTDFGMADISFKGIAIKFDPTLDDLGFGKRLYVIDTSNITLRYMKGEKRKRHTPARPADRYVMFRAITTTAVLTARQLNSSGVYLAS